MIDCYGNWTWAPDIPRNNFCDLDYVMESIENHGGYTPQHASMETILVMVIDDYWKDVRAKGKPYFAIKEPNPDSPLMINGEDVWEYIQACGGLKEFDFDA